MCPFGFTGDFCQSRIRITKPSFHPTADYASYVSYYGLPHLHDYFQMKFHLVTKNYTQIALLLYIGVERKLERAVLLEQIENPIEPKVTELSKESDVKTDFFSLSFLKGFLGVTWNLGSGTQRIVTPSKIDPRLHIHTIYFGRSGRQAWIKVDGMRNITGRSPGKFFQLNVDEELYVGGYETHKLEDLPHDLPLHNGFQGCIFDLGLRIKNRLFLPKPFKGRNVKNCFEDC